MSHFTGIISVLLTGSLRPKADTIHVHTGFEVMLV